MSSHSLFENDPIPRSDSNSKILNSCQSTDEEFSFDKHNDEYFKIFREGMKKEGTGIYYEDDGTIYEGQWKNDMKNGLGK